MVEGLDTTEFKTGVLGGDQPRDPRPAVGVPRAGDVLAEKYLVERVLGLGGMGVVVAVKHLQIGEPYAIKLLLPTGQADPEMVERFMREARAAIRIKSEHIVRVNDVGQLANGAPFLLMEYLVGRDLADVLQTGGPLPPHVAAEYVLQACAGVAEAHALGIVHRDLKPSNLFLTQRSDGAPLVKVLDFGIAKAMDGDHNVALTQTTSAFGSPAYMSPEQVRSAKRVDFRTDVWALGVIMFELLTGELPFRAETSPGILAAIAADEPLTVRELRPEIDPDLSALVRRCLEKDMNRRVQSVAELADLLAPFAGETLVSVGRIKRLARPMLPSFNDVTGSSRAPSAAPSAPNPPSGPAVISSGPRLAAETRFAGVTEKPWVTRPERRSSSNTTRIILVASLAAVLTGGLATVVGLRIATRANAKPDPTVSAPTIPPTTPPEGLTADAPSTAAAPSGTLDPTPTGATHGAHTAPGISPTPPASPTIAPNASPLGDASGRKPVATTPRPPPKGTPTTTKPTLPDAPSPAPAPPPPAPPKPNRDPLGESH